MPPLPTLIIPCVLGTFMFTLALIDLAVDLTGDGALIVAWCGPSPLPIVKHFLMYVLPLLLLGLLAKTALKSVPGVLKGTAGCGYACGPVLLIPVVIALTVAAKAALDPELATFSSRDPIDADVLAWVTQLHALKCSGLARHHGVRHHRVHRRNGGSRGGGAQGGSDQGGG